MSFGASIASGHFDIVISDSDQPKTFYGLWVGVAGDVYVKDVDGTVCLYKVATPGYIGIKGKAVMLSTTATNIIGLYK